MSLVTEKMNAFVADIQKKLILQVLILLLQAGTYGYLLVGHGENVALILLQLLGYFACLRTVPAVKKAKGEA